MSRRYPSYHTVIERGNRLMKQRDFFVCHASEDKRHPVKPLVAALRRADPIRVRQRDVKHTYQQADPKQSPRQLALVGRVEEALCTRQLG